MRLLAVNNKSKKQTVKKEFSIFLSHIRLQNQHGSLMYWLKICKAWVRSQLRWAWNWLKLKVTSSNVLRIIIHWLSARRDVGLTQGSLTPKEHSLYRALKHSIRQHKLDLNLSKTKQFLPIITNSLSLELQISYGLRQLVHTEFENRPSSHLTKHSTPARGKKLSSSKQLAWNLYTVSRKVLKNIRQMNSSVKLAFRHILWFQ